MGYRPTNASVTVTDLARAIGCTGFCSIRPLLFDATGDGQTDRVLIHTAGSGWHLVNSFHYSFHLMQVFTQIRLFIGS